MSHKVKNIAVYCASSDKIEETYFRDAHLLGELIGERGLTLINGAGNMGLMKTSADACMAAGGETIGIIPSFMIEQNWHHLGMTRLIETKDMHERQKLMSDMSDAAIVLAGGCGTLAELSELFTWKQLGLYLKPIVILNTNNYWDDLLAYFQKAANENFMRPIHLEAIQIAKTPEEAIQLALTTPCWDDSIRRHAKIS